jgi:hypothetical protein
MGEVVTSMNHLVNVNGKKIPVQEFIDNKLGFLSLPIDEIVSTRHQYMHALNACVYHYRNQDYDSDDDEEFNDHYARRQVIKIVAVMNVMSCLMDTINGSKVMEEFQKGIFKFLEKKKRKINPQFKKTSLERKFKTNLNEDYHDEFEKLMRFDLINDLEKKIQEQRKNEKKLKRKINELNFKLGNKMKKFKREKSKLVDLVDHKERKRMLENNKMRSTISSMKGTIRDMKSHIASLSIKVQEMIESSIKAFKDKTEVKYEKLLIKAKKTREIAQRIKAKLALEKKRSGDVFSTFAILANKVKELEFDNKQLHDTKILNLLLYIHEVCLKYGINITDDQIT